MSGFTQVHPLISGIIRVGPECFGWGDPWTWCVNYKDEGNGCVFLYGAVKMPSGDEMKWLIEVLFEMGFEYARWERIKGGFARTTRYFKVDRWHLSEVIGVPPHIQHAGKHAESIERFSYAARTANWGG